MKVQGQFCLRFLLGFLTSVSLTGGPAQGAPPPNDDFANATVIPTLTNLVPHMQSFTGSTLGATVEPGEAAVPDLAAVNRHGTLWWKWTCFHPGFVLLHAWPLQASLMAAVFTGSSLEDLTTVSPPTSIEDLPEDPWLGWAAFSAEPGTTYWFVVMQHPESEDPPGDFLLDFAFTPDPPPPPPNDHFADRILLTGTNVTVEGDNWASSAEAWEPVGWPWARFPFTVWYSWTASAPGVVYFSIESLEPDIPFSLGTYQGQPPSWTVPPVTADGGFLVAPGDTIHLQVASPENPARWYGGGRFALRIRQTVRAPASANDALANRVDLVLGDEPWTGSLYEATVEPGEPLPAAGLTQSLWWRLVPPDEGVVQFLLTSAFPMQLALYEGTDFPNMMRQPAGNGLRFRVQAGREYAVQVASGPAPFGGLTLGTRFYSLSNDFFAGSLRIAGTNVNLTGNLAFTTTEPDEPPDSGSQSVWLSWEAPFAGPVVFALGPYYRPQAARAFVGPAMGHLQEVPLISLVANVVSFLATEGAVYHFQIIGEGEEYSFRLDASPFQPAVHDHFADARVLTGRTIPWTPLSVVGATLEVGEPPHLGPVPQKSVWCRWQAPRSGYFSLTARSVYIPSVMLAVYQGPSVGALGLVAKGTNAVKFLALGGETYAIALAVSEAALGDISVSGQLGGLSDTSPLLPGNLFQDPSWEHWSLASQNPYWGKSGDIGGYGNAPGGLHGGSWPVLSTGARVWQDVPTLPGREYAVQFGYHAQNPNAACCPVDVVRVYWDDREPVLSAVAPHEFNTWQWEVLTFTASNTVSRITFESLFWRLHMDAFSVVDLSAPPAIVTQPTSLSAVSGGAAAFIVNARGTGPLGYQWFFQGQPLPGQNAAVLLLDPVTAAHAGNYHVVVTNALGAAISTIATLTVDAPAQPTILLQPYSVTTPAGGYALFTTLASGTAPLTYQWFFNREPIAEATNRHLVLSNVQPAQAGAYEVRVQNPAGTVWSLPASLRVTQGAGGGGVVEFWNRVTVSSGVTNEAPVFDLDGLTPLNGPAYVAQLYAGPTLEALRPVGGPVPFLPGFQAGFFQRRVVTLPDVPPGATALVQVRVWESARGGSYEEARAWGEKFGRSEVFEVTAGGDARPPAPLIGLTSFNLRAGLPVFNVGVIEFVERQPDGLLVWSLRGEAGFRYVVEKSTLEDEGLWRPFQVLTNVTGTVTFTDTTEAGAEAVFYRARILD